ncbi:MULTISPECIES: flagellar protein FlaG [unclassified Clostridium]|uniref:flagellar protein FlaG n=1 Tax=unclassified Clostridium TaxID=2614128 RepID=UPI000EDE9041|nr:MULTISPECIES: flagellar protein FlaG [unclassified Clostridium]HCQ91057.1 flagellar protein [Clostridium sp.]
MKIGAMNTMINREVDYGMNLENKRLEQDENIIASEESTLVLEGDNYQKVKEKPLKVAVDRLNKFFSDKESYIEYEKHDVFNAYIVKIVDKETREVIREIPPRKILDMVASMCEIAGVLLDKKA